MFQIKTLNKISPVGLRELEGGKFVVGDDLTAPEGILVRSADMLSADLPESLLAIARAGAGTNNIPIDRCSEQGVVVFNTPGANANAVKELVLCGLLMASRKIAAGTQWLNAQCAEGVEVSTVVEKGKGQFVGPEIAGKTLGVIGLGAIGVKVANAATKLGMKVMGYDPYLSVHAALSLSSQVQVTDSTEGLEELYKAADYITLHLPQNDKTKGMVNAESLDHMKAGVRILNFARGGLVKDQDLIAALESGQVAAYVSDFPNNKLMAAPNTTFLPHLGASTPESEDNCAVMAARELADYLENGNIQNSVNLPETVMPRSGVARLCMIHRNSPGMLANITAAVAKEGLNVENLTNKSKGDYAYTLVDVNAPVTEETVAHIAGMENMLRLRVLA